MLRSPKPDKLGLILDASHLPEVFRPKNLNNLGLAVTDDLAEAFAPFDGLVQRVFDQILVHAFHH